MTPSFLVLLNAPNEGTFAGTQAREAVEFLLRNSGTTETELFGPFVRPPRARTGERYLTLIHVSVVPGRCDAPGVDRAEIEAGLRSALRIDRIEDVEIEVLPTVAAPGGKADE